MKYIQLFSVMLFPFFWHFYYKGGKTEEFSMTNEPLIKKLAGFCANSSLYRDTKAELDQLLDGQNKRSSAFKKFAYSTSIYHQLRWISWRSLKNFLGDRQMCITEVGFLSLGCEIVMWGKFGFVLFFSRIVYLLPILPCVCHPHSI